MGFGERGSEGISSGCTRDCTRCGECESPGVSAGDFTCIMYNTDMEDGNLHTYMYKVGMYRQTSVVPT